MPEKKALVCTPDAPIRVTPLSPNTPGCLIQILSLSAPIYPVPASLPRARLRFPTVAEVDKATGMTQVKYAKHWGVSKQAVNDKYIKAGLLTRENGAILENGNIDVEVADEILDDVLDPARTGSTGGQESGKKGDRLTGNDTKTFSARKLYRLNLLIEREEREMEIDEGKVVYRKPARSAYGAKVGAVINRLRKLSKRIAPALAKETDPHKCEMMVKAEIKEAVAEFN